MSGDLHMSVKLGFIGLGLMGKPMSTNLIKAGYKVTVWNRTSTHMQPLVEIGAQTAASPSEVASNSDITITIVSDSLDVEEVILGQNGVIYGAKPGSVVVDMSTISPTVTTKIAATLKESLIHMIDAPVSGGDTGAKGGTLSIMAGGDKEIFDRCLPIMNVMGSTVTYCGSNGMGQITKLVNQIVGLGTLAAMCEGLIFAAKSGADPEAVLNALSGGAANSWMVENQGAKIFERDFRPGFMVDLAQKDLRLVQEYASEINLPLITTPIVSQIYRTVQRLGGGRDGIQSYVKGLETLSGIKLNK